MNDKALHILELAEGLEKLYRSLDGLSVNFNRAREEFEKHKLLLENLHQAIEIQEIKLKKYLLKD